MTKQLSNSPGKTALSMAKTGYRTFLSFSFVRNDNKSSVKSRIRKGRDGVCKPWPINIFSIVCQVIMIDFPE